MFGKLKEKLKGFTSSLSEKIDAKAVDSKEPETVIQAEPSEIEAPKQIEPAVDETPKQTKPAVSETPKQTKPAEAETPKQTKPTVSETPKQTKPAEVETPKKTKPAEVETPKQTKPAVSETPKQTKPAISGTPKQTVPEKTEPTKLTDFAAKDDEKSESINEPKKIKPTTLTDFDVNDTEKSEPANKSKKTVNEPETEAVSETEIEAVGETEIKAVDETEIETESKTQSDAPEKPDEKKASEPKKEKTGFFGKAKALILDREIILDEKDLEGPLMDLEIALLESDLALSVTDSIVASVKEQLNGTRKRVGKNTGNIVEEALKTAILEVMSANVFDFDEFIESRRDKTVHIAFIGINGTGKTTSIAKIANRLQKNGYSVTIAAGDTFRAGAIDQIQIHADRLGIKVIRHQEGSDPAAVVYDALQYSKAHKVNVLLSDTAGRMHTNVNLMAQLEKICRVSTPDLIIFVDEATAGNDAVERASQFSAAVPINGTILTKLDADSKGGAAISIAYITQKPILFFGVGQGYDDLMKFDSEWFVDQIFNDS